MNDAEIRALQARERALQRKRERIRKLAAAPGQGPRGCRMFPCPNPVRGSTTKGVGQRYCLAHEDHLRRHGSAWKRSYSAAVLNPYRRAALLWLRMQAGRSLYASKAVQAVRTLYATAGEYIAAGSLRGLPPRDRARATWARLRKGNVDPMLPLAGYLAVEMAHQEDPHQENHREYRQVQAAKVVHRLAGGTHYRWEREDTATRRIHVTKRSVYAPSRGRVLRHLGQQIERAGELVTEHHLGDLLTAKREMHTRGMRGRRAVPKVKRKMSPT